MVHSGTCKTITSSTTLNQRHSSNEKGARDERENLILMLSKRSACMLLLKVEDIVANVGVIYPMRSNLCRPTSIFGNCAGSGAFTLLYHKKPFPKPLQLECAHNFQKSKHTLQRSLRPLMGGQKV
jgi:hypothetical protein